MWQANAGLPEGVGHRNNDERERTAFALERPSRVTIGAWHRW